MTLGTDTCVPLALVALLGSAFLGSACIAPVSVGAPEPASTVGKGEVRATARAEIPSLNLVSDEEEESLQQEGLLTPVAGLEGAYGLAPWLDVEAGLDMPLHYLILPIPNAVWLGLRTQVVDQEAANVALSARVGGLALGKVGGDIETDEEAKARFGSLGASAHFGSGTVRPGLAVRYSAYDVSTSGIRNVESEFVASMKTLTPYVTIRSSPFAITPFINIARFDSPNIDGVQSWFSGGITFSLQTGASDEFVPPLLGPPPAPAAAPIDPVAP